MSKPDDLDDIRRDDEALDRRDFDEGTLLGDLRDYGSYR